MESRVHESVDSLTPDSFNDYFVNASSRCAASIIMPDSAGLKTILSFYKCSPRDISRAVMSIESNAVGMDGVPIKFIKLVLPLIEGPRTHICNSCIKLGMFPLAWKSSLVNPIPKVQSPKSISDFRPISILHIPAKMSEIILLYVFTDFIMILRAISLTDFVKRYLFGWIL